MRKVLLATGIGVMAMHSPPAAPADEALDKLAKDPKQWVMQQGDDANTRYSKLNQINASNVKKLQVAWTFSTGVLRGHEGGPLVVGDMMYVHTPFPNTVYALDLKNEGKILWKYEPRQDPERHPDHVLRHRQPRRRLCATARSSCTRPTRRWSRSTPRPAPRSGR